MTARPRNSAGLRAEIAECTDAVWKRVLEAELRHISNPRNFYRDDSGRLCCKDFDQWKILCHITGSEDSAVRYLESQA